MWAPWGGGGRRCWRRGSCCSSPSWAQSCTGHTPYCPMFWLPAYDHVDNGNKIKKMSFVKVPCDKHYYCWYIFLHSLVTCDVSWIFSIESFTVWTQFCPEVDAGREACSQAGEGKCFVITKQRFTAKLLPYEDCWHQQPVSPLHPELRLTPLLQSKVWTVITVLMLSYQWWVRLKGVNEFLW